MTKKVEVNFENIIKDRMKILVEDVKTVQDRIGNAERQIVEDRGTLNALLGAYQQCEAFLKVLNNAERDGE